MLAQEFVSLRSSSGSSLPDGQQRGEGDDYVRVPVQRRLQRASFRLEMAQLERVWAVLSASRQDWSMRDIAQAVGLSPTRVHPILGQGTDHPVEAAQSVLREAGWPTPEDDTAYPETISDRLSDEANLISQCAD